MSYCTPRSAYIHVPFCAHRCGYCNFTLVAGRDDLVEPYLEALTRELSALEAPREVDTLFIGGGTPTQLKGHVLRRFLALVLQWHPLAAGHEFTVEANPSDVDAQCVSILAEYGVNRLSLGAQSFRDGKLRVLERDHSARDIERSVELARSSGMDVAIDLIFAAPNETLVDWQSDLRATISLAPEHISTYGLTYERGTQFWNRRRRGEVTAADEELERAMYEEAIDQLAAAGLEHYEVSNFAQPNKRCRHNEAYWLGREFYAAGPGAARYISGWRSVNRRSTTAYIKRVLGGDSPIAEQEELPPRERALELLVFALRRLQGVARDWFEENAQVSLDALVGPAVKRLVELGMISDSGARIRLTRRGLLVADSVCSEFLTAAAGQASRSV